MTVNDANGKKFKPSAKEGKKPPCPSYTVSCSRFILQYLLPRLRAGVGASSAPSSNVVLYRLISHPDEEGLATEPRAKEVHRQESEALPCPGRSKSCRQSVLCSRLASKPCSDSKTRVDVVSAPDESGFVTVSGNKFKSAVEESAAPLSPGRFKSRGPSICARSSSKTCLASKTRADTVFPPDKHGFVTVNGNKFKPLVKESKAKPPRPSRSKSRGRSTRAHSLSKTRSRSKSKSNANIVMISGKSYKNQLSSPAPDEKNSEQKSEDKMHATLPKCSVLRALQLVALMRAT